MSEEIEKVKKQLRLCEEGKTILYNALKQAERQRDALLEYIGNKED